MEGVIPVVRVGIILQNAFAASVYDLELMWSVSGTRYWYSDWAGGKETFGYVKTIPNTWVSLSLQLLDVLGKKPKKLTTKEHTIQNMFWEKQNTGRHTKLSLNKSNSEK